MRFCGIDFEATDKIPATARITEAGWSVFDFEPRDIGSEHEYSEDFSSYALVSGGNCFVCEDDYPAELSEEVQAVTGLTMGMIRGSGFKFTIFVDRLLSHLSGVDYFLAHNAHGYDKPLFYAEIERHSAELGPDKIAALKAVPWLCSISDIEYRGVRTKCRVLSHLALENGVIVDPSTLHRASDDVSLMIRMLEAAHIDMSEVVAISKIPAAIYRAKVPKPWDDNGAGKDKAKACGFGWTRAPGTDGPTFENSWVKKIKEDKINEEKEKLGYEITKVAEA